MLKKIGLAVGVILGLVIAGVFAFQSQLGMVLFKVAFDAQSEPSLVSDFEDGLHLGLCGTGSPMPNVNRAGPCNLVVAGDKTFIVDVGEGASRNLSLMGVNASNVDAVFLTHFHSDHIDGMGPMMLLHWVREGNPVPLQVHGPTGVETVIEGFNATYATDDTYRTAHHGEDVAPKTGGGAIAHPFEMASDTRQVFKDADLTITAFNVVHAPVFPAVGYRFDYKGRSLCISGDTAQSANLEKVCKSVDIIVHDSLQPKMVEEMALGMEKKGNLVAAKIFSDILDYHASPEQAAESAQRADAKMLVLSHLVPPLPTDYLYAAFLGDAPNRFDGPVVIGEDGMVFSMPTGSDAIERSSVM